MKMTVRAYVGPYTPCYEDRDTGVWVKCDDPRVSEFARCHRVQFRASIEYVLKNLAIHAEDLDEAANVLKD